MNSQWIAWIYLIVAGIFEILWVIGMKYSDSFTKFWPTIATLIAMALSILLLGRAVKVFVEYIEITYGAIIMPVV